MKIDFTLIGGAELAEALRQLPAAAGRSVARRALKKAAEPIRARAAYLAPRSDEAPHLADNIGISNTRRVMGKWLTRDETAVAIGPTSPTDQGGGGRRDPTDFFYGLFIEKGTQTELGTVKMPARPFLRPAFDAGAAQATVEIGQEVGNELKLHAARAAAKVARAAKP